MMNIQTIELWRSFGEEGPAEQCKTPWPWLQALWRQGPVALNRDGPEFLITVYRPVWDYATGQSMGQAVAALVQRLALCQPQLTPGHVPV